MDFSVEQKQEIDRFAAHDCGFNESPMVPALCEVVEETTTSKYENISNDFSFILYSLSKRCVENAVNQDFAVLLNEYFDVTRITEKIYNVL